MIKFSIFNSISAYRWWPQKIRKPRFRRRPTMRERSKNWNRHCLRHCWRHKIKVSDGNCILEFAAITKNRLTRQHTHTNNFVVCTYFVCIVNKVSPRPSIAPDSDAANSAEAFNQQAQSQPAQPNQSSSSSSLQQNKPEPGKAPSRAGACRVCLKSFKPDEFSKICFECQQKVCEDCASYSKLEEHEDAVCMRVCAMRSRSASSFERPNWFGIFLHFFRLKNYIHSARGDAVCADGKWLLVYAFHKIRQTQC